jgi:hypothetical protein
LLKYNKKDFKSDLLIPPIGLMSAALQSYFVRYPLNPSAIFEELRTNKNPFSDFVQGISYAIKYETTILTRACIFCKARSSPYVPPYTTNFGCISVAF